MLRFSILIIDSLDSVSKPEMFNIFSRSLPCKSRTGILFPNPSKANQIFSDTSESLGSVSNSKTKI
ncbi:hypothetical protein LEP1GSC061_1923 [Leptospira wolffii serovar Khorat str. Khorat-H2]|nr:hypothetical protein LEP1GSC061_1923 [Leptospira wolffii serovar Khorat str. Khorat-H2]